MGRVSRKWQNDTLGGICELDWCIAGLRRARELSVLAPACTALIHVRLLLSQWQPLISRLTRILLASFLSANRQTDQTLERAGESVLRAPSRASNSKVLRY